MTSSDENVSRIKRGASLLANGGTLTSEPCPRCKGVQVRLRDNITCINCGNELNTDVARLQTEREREKEKATPAPTSAGLTSAASMIEEKIALLASEIRVEDDVSMQRQKAELLERYLGILEKTRSLIG
jgi:uncharacterized Zn finger protein (UPF0148 family)